MLINTILHNNIIIIIIIFGSSRKKRYKITIISKLNIIKIKQFNVVEVIMIGELDN